jgi:YD repeat-containing protein
MSLFDRIGRQSNRRTTLYDLAGRMLATINPLGRRNTTVFDAASQVKASVNGLGFRTSFVYDIAIPSS